MYQRVSKLCRDCMYTNESVSICYYHTAGNIGGQLNLAVWRLEKRQSNLNPSNLSAIYATYVLFYACAHIICTELPPNLNPPIFLFRLLGTKLPNLKIANISGYTVYFCYFLTFHSALYFFALSFGKHSLSLFQK